MSVFICPVCGENLGKSENSYVCSHNHSFDCARSGYVNLLISKQIGKAVHGDNKLMLRARRSFLEKGYYAPLRDVLCNEVLNRFCGGLVLDAGCGEGYYTSAISKSLMQSGNLTGIYGIDISKTAVDMAAKRHDNVIYAAASVFHIPMKDDSCDMLVTLFAPYCGNEFIRVLKPGGVMVMVIPSELHLWELKQEIYDVPYKNEVKPYELEGFALLDSKHIRYKMKLGSQEDIQALFSMTPYYYRTGVNQQERLAALDKLDITADFELLIYKNSK